VPNRGRDRDRGRGRGRGRGCGRGHGRGRGCGHGRENGVGNNDAYDNNDDGSLPPPVNVPEGAEGGRIEAGPRRSGHQRKSRERLIESCNIRAVEALSSNFEFCADDGSDGAMAMSMTMAMAVAVPVRGSLYLNDDDTNFALILPVGSVDGELDDENTTTLLVRVEFKKNEMLPNTLMPVLLEQSRLKMNLKPGI
jgi:hypothetical protein